MMVIRSNNSNCNLPDYDSCYNEFIVRAPAFVSKDKSPTRLSRYEFVNSMDVVRALYDRGWVVDSYGQEGKNKVANDRDRVEYKRHWAVFKNAKLDMLNNDNEFVPRFMFVNSHDGTSRFDIIFLVLRKVCTNGLFLTRSFQQRRIRHDKGILSETDIESFIHNMDSYYDEVMSKSSVMKSIYLTQSEKLEFARHCKEIRWKYRDNKSFKLNEERLLEPRRDSDRGDDFWRVFNVVQENITKGGVLTDDSKFDKPKRYTTRDLQDKFYEIEMSKNLLKLVDNRINHGKFLM